MFDQCEIGGRRFAPARFAAPLAGYTHSAFRRFIAEFGGCGAVWTEMLSARQLIIEDFSKSPWLKRSPGEKFTVYQLMVRTGDPIERVLERLQQNGVEAIDLNLACYAPHIRSLQAGSALFNDFDGLKQIMSETRKRWPGLMFVKIRLGDRRPDWQDRIKERLALIQDCGADALIVHPRFFEDKFKRSARHDLLPWIASMVKIPVIASGDITCREDVLKLADELSAASAIMLGRIAVIKPWIFASWDKPFPVDYAAVWNKMIVYIMEDFEPPVAISRIKMFAKYYSANFAFGKNFYNRIYNARSIDEIKEIADEFFSSNPPVNTKAFIVQW